MYFSSIYIYIDVCLRIYLSICLSAYLLTCLPSYLPIGLAVYRSIDLSIYRSMGLSICVYIYTHVHTYISVSPCVHIYDPGSRFADPPPHPRPSPKPNLCDFAQFLHMQAPKPSSVTRIASQRTALIFPARFTCEAAKAINCHEDRVPNTPDPCDCGHFPKNKQGNCHEDCVP